MECIGLPTNQPQGARPTNGISIELEFYKNFESSSLKYAEPITTEFCTRHGNFTVVVCKILWWSVEYILNQSTANFGRISNSIEISLVGRAQGHEFESCLTWTCVGGRYHPFIYEDLSPANDITKLP